MADWNDEYYDRKEKEHMELVECWCYAVLVCIAIAAAVAAVLGGYAMARSLMGGA